MTSEKFNPKDFYDLPMTPVAMHFDKNLANPRALGWGRAKKNNVEVEVLVMTSKDPQLTRKAYIMLQALINGEIS